MDIFIRFKTPLSSFGTIYDNLQGKIVVVWWMKIKDVSDIEGQVMSVGLEGNGLKRAE